MKYFDIALLWMGYFDIALAALYQLIARLYACNSTNTACSIRVAPSTVYVQDIRQNFVRSVGMEIN